MRISTQPLYDYLNGKTYDEAIPYLVKFDQLVEKSNVILAIGAIMRDEYPAFEILEWAVKLIKGME